MRAGELDQRGRRDGAVGVEHDGAVGADLLRGLPRIARRSRRCRPGVPAVLVGPPAAEP